MRRRYILLTVLALLLLLPLPAYTDGEIIIDVVDGYFLSGAHRIQMADTGAPVALYFEENRILVQINAVDGVVNLDLGEGQLALIERAAPYVFFVENEQPLYVVPDNGESCPICLRTTAIGNHTMLECGHYGCLVTLDHPIVCETCGEFVCNTKDHTPCEYCGVSACEHVNLYCEHWRNPAPTAFATRSPDGSSVRQYVDPYGEYVDGTNRSSSEWTPGKEYEKANATPTPAPAP